MGAASDYLENALLNHLLGGGDYARPATVYLALFTVAPSDAGGGTEVAAEDYARLAIANDATQWPAAAAGAKTNGEALAFDPAETAWGTVVAVGVFDAAAGGNLLVWATMDALVVDEGDQVEFAAGGIEVTLD